MENTNGQNPTKKKKFTPNISKALTKKRQSDIPSPKHKLCKSNGGVKEGAAKRPRINRRLLESDEPRFVQSYSIFEQGLGVFTKAGNRIVEMQSQSSRPSTSRIATQPLTTTAGFMEVEPVASVVNDLNQIFRYPPTSMPPDPPGVGFGDMHLLSTPTYSTSRDDPSIVHPSQYPAHLFGEEVGRNGGNIFSLRVPDALMIEESPLQKEGKFGKIQLLSNGEARLVIGDCFFRLCSTGPAPYSSDLLMVEEPEENDGKEDVEGGGVVHLNSLGHIEQFVSAVPDLDRFSELGH